MKNKKTKKSKFEMEEKTNVEDKIEKMLDEDPQNEIIDNSEEDSSGELIELDDYI